MSILSINLKTFSLFKVLGLYIVFLIIAFFPFIIGKGTLRWDAPDQYLPWSHFLEYSIKNWSLPLWNPFVHMGTPTFADPQSTTWYPVSWVVAFSIGFDYQTISWVYLLHLVFAGLGFYKLSLNFNLNKSIAFICGASYMFSGLFISNAEHMSWITSATWLPYIILYFLKIAESRSIIPQIKFSLFMFLALTGGYPGFFFVLFYCMLLYFLWIFIKSILQKNFNYILLLIRNYAFTAIFTLIICSVYLLSIILLSGEFSRGEKLPLNIMFQGPFPYNAIVSFIFPFVTLKIEHFNSDISMTNGYMGLMTVIFFIVGLFQLKDRLPIILLTCFFIFLFISFGDGFFLRELLYDYVPIMGHFRFPSLFRIFFIISAILFSGIFLQKVLYDNTNAYKGLVKNVLLGLLLGVLLAIVIGCFNSSSNLFILWKKNSYHNSQLSNFWNYIVIQGAYQVVFLAALLFIFIKLKNLQIKVWLITIVLIMDLISAARLNWYTVMEKGNIVELNQRLNKALSKPPVFNKYVSSINNNPENLIGQNLAIYYKFPTYDGYNPFQLKSLETFLKYPFKDSLLANTIGYLTCDLHLLENLPDQIPNRKYTVVKSKLPEVYCSKLDTITYFNIGFNQIFVNVISEKSTFLVVMQNYLPQWKATVNGKPETIYKVNENMMGIILPEGKSNVIFDFSPLPIILAACLSGISFIAALFLILLIEIKRKTKSMV